MKASSEGITVELHFQKHPNPKTMQREGQLPYTANKGRKVSKANSPHETL